MDNTTPTRDGKQIATASDPVELSRLMVRFCREHKYLYAISIPTGRIALYASSTAAVDAEIAARTDYPRGECMSEVRYLCAAEINAMRSQAMARDPVAQALRHLGPT